MPVYVALLRAVNVGGTGKLSMKALSALCTDAGFTGVQTYIQSGNVVLQSRKAQRGVKATLEAALEAKMGKPVGVLVRSAAEISAIVDDNPFPGAKPNQVLAFFLDAPPAAGILDGIATPAGEQIVVRGREVFVHYPGGMGRSKLKLPFEKIATARNLNTVRKLAALSGG